MKRLAPVLAAALLAGGCATVTISDEGGKSIVEVTNRGWYLLDFIPIASGNPDAPNECDFRLFRQTTTLENNARMLDWAVAARNATGLKAISSYTHDETVLLLLFKRHAIHTCAELVFDDERKD